VSAFIWYVAISSTLTETGCSWLPAAASLAISAHHSNSRIRSGIWTFRRSSHFAPSSGPIFERNVGFAADHTMMIAPFASGPWLRCLAAARLCARARAPANRKRNSAKLARVMRHRRLAGRFRWARRPNRNNSKCRFDTRQSRGCAERS